MTYLQAGDPTVSQTETGFPHPWMLVVGNASWERKLAKKSALRLVSTNTRIRSAPGQEEMAGQVE